MPALAGCADDPEPPATATAPRSTPPRSRAAHARGDDLRVRDRVRAPGDLAEREAAGGEVQRGAVRVPQDARGVEARAFDLGRDREAGVAAAAAREVVLRPRVADRGRERVAGR